MTMILYLASIIHRFVGLLVYVNLFEPGLKG